MALKSSNNKKATKIPKNFLKIQKCKTQNCKCSQ